MNYYIRAIRLFLFLYLLVLCTRGAYILLEEKIAKNERKYQEGPVWYDFGNGFKMLEQKRFHPNYTDYNRNLEYKEES